MEGTVTGKKLVGTLYSGGSMVGGVGTVFGKDGITPHIGANGNWWLDDQDTGVSARGERGEKGEKGDKGADGTMSFEDLTPEQKESLKGDTGSSGVYVGTTEPTDASVNVWINPSGRAVPIYNGEVE